MNARSALWNVGSALGLWTLVSAASAESGTAQTLSPREIAALLGKATVTIQVLASDGTARSGSGFIVDPTGTVVTNVHVVEGAKKIEVHVSNGDVYEPAGVRVADTRRDIAVLQLAAFNLPSAKLADSDAVAAGHRVVVIGTALGVLENSVTSGVISGIREVEGSRLFQMDAAVSPGNSGGPVANEHGEVIGITVSKLTGGQSLNFAIPINYARGELSLPVQQGLGALNASQHAELLAANHSPIPKRWKSLTTGNTNDVQVSGDVMLVETELPQAATNAGAKIWAELKKDGDKWVGAAHNRSSCTHKASSFPLRFEQKWCQVDMPFQIRTLSGSKIEGTASRPPSDAQFDCDKCKYDRASVPTDFTWIPLEQ